MAEWFFAVAPPTAEKVREHGEVLERVWRVNETDEFEELLRAIDDADLRVPGLKQPPE